MFEPDVPRRQLTGHLAWFLCWVFVTGVGLFLLVPSSDGHGTHQQLGLAPCPSVLVLGRPCPGCGLTTSFTATLHGQLGTAFSAHLLGPVLYGLFTLTAFACLYGFVTQRRMRSETRAFNWMLGMVVAAFLGYGVIRFALTPGLKADLSGPSAWDRVFRRD